MGGPQTIASKSVLMAMTFAKAGPGFMSRLPGIVKGEAFSKMNSFVFKLMDNLNNGDVTLENSQKSSVVLNGHSKVCSFLIDVASSGREAPIEPQEVEINYQQDDSVRYMLGELSEAAAKV